MPTPKAIVCGCEDVTREEIARAFHAGHRDLESVKRYTGLGTGPCQGKSCLALAVEELRRLGATDAEALPFTARAPVDPVSLAALASLDPASLDPSPWDAARPSTPPSPRIALDAAGLRSGRADLSDLQPPAPSPDARPGRAAASGPPSPAGTDPARTDGDAGAGPGERATPERPPLPARADVVIVGGGIMGLGLAYHLARRGRADVLVLERGYLNAGASGRNGGGVRAQWTTPTMIRLARRSLELCARFAVETGVNTWFRRGGYLFLAPTPAQVARIEKNLEVHRAGGLRTRVVTPDEACAIVPELDPRGFLAAAWNPDDAVVFPWPFLWGYADRARALGARVETFTRVEGFETEGPRVRAVLTDRGRVACEVVINAAGGWSKEVAALAGVRLPNRPTRHEIVVTEPNRPWLGPLVSVLGNGLYFSQSSRGELVGGMGDPAEPEGLNLGSSLAFLARFARAMTACAPATGSLRVVRQWAGFYDVTPDHNPILGAAGFDNFLQLSGFVGHGFMMAPAVTEAMAAWMCGEPPDPIFEQFTLSRFDRPGGVAPEDFVIG